MSKASGKVVYIQPEAEVLSWLPFHVLASSYNPDDHTEYIDYEDGGLI